jgi:glycosyltransferase involved in cell wall biosynthesis
LRSGSISDSISTAPRRILIMPAHNEAGNIERVIREVRAVAPPLDIVVINDCSKDDTAKIAARLGATVISLPCNLGYGGAIQTGFRYAVAHGYGVGVLMDADGQHDPRCIADLLAVVESGHADVALGSRFLGRLEYKAGPIRRAGMAFFRTIVSRLIHQRITDPTSGFQALTYRVMRFFAADNYPSDFPDADTIIVLAYAGFRLQEVPVTMRERISGVSMHANLKPIYYVIKMLLSIGVVLLRQRTNAGARYRVSSAEPATGADKPAEG